MDVVNNMVDRIRSKITNGDKQPFYVTKRFSGTQGLTIPDTEFFKCIKHPGLLPKKLPVVK